MVREGFRFDFDFGWVEAAACKKKERAFGEVRERLDYLDI